MKFNFFSKEQPTLLIYGHRGWIGSMYLNYLSLHHPKLKIIKGIARIDIRHEVIYEINEYRPTHIFSLTGRTHGTIEDKLINTIDYLEYPGKLVENVQDNLYGPLNLAIICKEKDIHYTYLGTGCIFNSTGLNSEAPQKFTEESYPNYFGSGYSVVKGFTDRIMGDFPVLNLRIRMPISSTPNDRNFINKITKYQFICSIPNSMTVLDDFFPIFTDLLLKKKTGTYNCTNPGIISHNQILEMYKQIIDPSFTWKNMTLEEQSKILKSDRSNNYLDTSKIKKEYPNLKGIHDSMIIVLNKMKLI
uniref:NAD-dependent epimerase/dehydratase domain-containing protein n=1 Tax=viral metagenome TaxID=1070528 RepID=A0A6C0AZY3_9ZZZZ